MITRIGQEDDAVPEKEEECEEEQPQPQQLSDDGGADLASRVVGVTAKHRGQLLLELRDRQLRDIWTVAHR